MEVSQESVLSFEYDNDDSSTSDFLDNLDDNSTKSFEIIIEYSVTEYVLSFMKSSLWLVAKRDPISDHISIVYQISSFISKAEGYPKWSSSIKRDAYLNIHGIVKNWSFVFMSLPIENDSEVHVTEKEKQYAILWQIWISLVSSFEIQNV